MNHHQDIDDGLEEFEDSQHRRAAEARFSAQKSWFDQSIDGAPFKGSRITELILSGPDTQQRNHPFSFESGYASVTGTLNGVPARLTVRWSANGANEELDVNVIER